MSTTTAAPAAKKTASKRVAPKVKKYVLVLDPKLRHLRESIEERLETLVEPDPAPFRLGEEDPDFIAQLEELDADANLIEHLASLPAGISLGLGVLAHCSVNRWEELLQRIAAHEGNTIKKLGSLALTPWQQNLLSEYDEELRLVHRSKPSASIAACPVCGMYVLIAGAAPGSCQSTNNCSGKPFKVTAPKKIEVTPEQAEAILADEEPLPDYPVRVAKAGAKDVEEEEPSESESAED